MRPQIVKARGGTIGTLFPKRPSSATVTIKRYSNGDLDDTAVEDSVATVHALELEVTADAVSLASGNREIPSVEVTLVDDDIPTAGPREGDVIEIASVAGRRSYVTTITEVMITDATEVPALATIVVRDPLPFAVVAGDTLKGVRVSYTLTAAQVPRVEQNFRAVFRATVAGAEMEREVIFDVGLRESYNPATVIDVKESWPDLAESEVIEWQNTGAAPALDSSWEDVCRKFFSVGKNPNRIRDVLSLRPLVVNRVFRRLAMFGLVPAVWADKVPEYIALLDSTFATLFGEVIAGVQWYDDEDDGIATSVELPATGDAGTIRLRR